MRTKEYRLAQIERLKKNRKHYWNNSLNTKHAGMALTTPKICSCWMCGNPRKYFGDRTIQELKLFQFID